MAEINYVVGKCLYNRVALNLQNTDLYFNGYLVKILMLIVLFAHHVMNFHSMNRTNRDSFRLLLEWQEALVCREHQVKRHLNFCPSRRDQGISVRLKGLAKTDLAAFGTGCGSEPK